MNSHIIPSLGPRSRRASLFALLASGLLSLSATAAPQIYFQLEGADIQSDQVPAAWEGWMIGRAFGQSLAGQARADGSGQMVPKLSKDFHVSKHLDKATPKLAEALTSGKVFPKLTVVYLSEGALEQDAVRVILENVSVVSQRVATQPSGRLGEDVAFAYGNAEFRYNEPAADESLNTNQKSSAPEFALDGPDSDKDGLPDAWEKAHGLNPDGIDCDEDCDHDGLTNAEEFAAGSLPNDRRSRFGIDRITLMRDKPGRGVVSFRALPRREYRLLGSPTGQHWFELDRFSLPVDGHEVQQEIELPLTGLTQLLRVEVVLQN